MAMRSRTTFKKRQKELARQEKQRDKAARRVQRKLEKNSPDAGDGINEDGSLEDGTLEDGMEDGVQDGGGALEPVGPSVVSRDAP